MRSVRLCILLLLAALLPVRGAVAAAMLCPMGSPIGNSTDATALVAHPHAGHAASGQHEHAHHHHAASTHHAHGDATSDDKCSLCVAFCSMTPLLLGELPSVPGPQEASTLRFPALAAAPPSFVSGGQERPPRRI